MRLSAIAKKIIVSRLYDRGIIIKPCDLNDYIIDKNSFTDNNTMYNTIVNNYRKLNIN